MAEHHPLRTPDQDPSTAAYARLNAAAERRAKDCRSVAMPSLRHLRMRDYDVVYEPSDDTYLLIDAIGAELDAMQENCNIEEGGIKPSDVRTTLEIGCGTGTPTVYLAMRLRESTRQEGERPSIDANKDGVESSSMHYVTDINADAIRIAQSTAEENGIPASDFRAHQCDLASDLLDPLEGKVDVLIFNPPYVPTPDEEVGSSGIEASWAGGKDGRVVLDRALPQIARLLAYPRGAAYVVTVDDNYPEQIAKEMEERYGIEVVPWFRRRARNEFLTILKMTPTRAFSGE
ncbi:hypothetical protein ACHAXT_007175 [Thalassiosira profunda]